MIEKEHYKKALLIRRTEDTFLDLFSKGKMNGTVHTCNGQEFSAVAFCSRLASGDTIFSNHRCHGHYIAKTNDVEGLIPELMGKESGVCGGVGSSQHLCNDGFYSNGIQGGIMPVAAGIAFANKLKQNKNVSLVFIGDGTLGEGAVYETMNLAALYKLPLLIICENNLYAQSTPQHLNLAGDILKRAEAFGIKTYHSDIWNLDKLFEASSESIEYVRTNQQPAFHLVDLYRLNPHSKSDDDRDKSEIESFTLKDPLNIFAKTHTSDYEQILTEINERINKIVATADEEREQLGAVYYDKGYGITVNNSLSKVELECTKERVITRINHFFDDVMGKDEKVLFIGEDVLSPYGGAFKASKNLSAKYPDNVFTTPISELGITGLCNGLALSGYKPYLEIMFGDFITLALDQIINHASKFHYMYNKKLHCPVVIRTPMGGGRGYGPTHSQTLDRLLAGINNVKLIALNSFVDPYLIYSNIHKNEVDPVVVIENKIDYGRMAGDKELPNYSVVRTDTLYPDVICSPVFASPTVTIVSYGGIASEVFEKLNEIFEETEQLIELVVLSEISPLDISSIMESYNKTNNIIIVEEGSRDFGIGSEILSSVIERSPGRKSGIAARIGAYPVPIPSARSMEDYILPNKRLFGEIVEILNN